MAISDFIVNGIRARCLQASYDQQQAPDASWRHGCVCCCLPSNNLRKWWLDGVLGVDVTRNPVLALKRKMKRYRWPRVSRSARTERCSAQIGGRLMACCRSSAPSTSEGPPCRSTCLRFKGIEFCLHANRTTCPASTETSPAMRAGPLPLEFQEKSVAVCALGQAARLRSDYEAGAQLQNADCPDCISLLPLDANQSLTSVLPDQCYLVSG